MLLNRIKINGQFTTIIGQDNDFYYTSDDLKIPKNKVRIHKKGYGVLASKLTIINKIKRLLSGDNDA